MRETNPVYVLAARAKRAGSVQAFAKSIGFSPQYLSDVLRGRRTASARLLAKLGLRRIVVEVGR